MRVLVACEFSGTVRDAFRARGHDAWSVDVLPTEADPAYHIQDDILHVLSSSTCGFLTWDMMIAHPPCTYLTYAGAKHLYIDGRKENGRDQARWDALEDAALFVRSLLAMPIPRIAVENPIMLAAARQIVGCSHSQIIQPWMFGHPENKRTCLWLKGLPHLRPTANVEAEMLALPRKLRDRIHYAGPGPNRWKERSRTFGGIAAAMADQWGDPGGQEQIDLFEEAA